MSPSAVLACARLFRRSPAPARPPTAGSASAATAAGGANRGRPLDAAALDQLAAVAIAGHDVTLARRGAGDLAAIGTGPGGVRVTVTASACLACTAMALPAWEARRAELAALWAPAESAAASLALAAPAVAGRTVIAVDACASRRRAAPHLPAALERRRRPARRGVRDQRPGRRRWGGAARRLRRRSRRRAGRVSQRPRWLKSRRLTVTGRTSH
jgi:hypothetical protein